jgi:hypothetical protein
VPGEHDFTVEYCENADPALTAWCVLQEGLIVFFDPVQELAVAMARRMAEDAGQAAWLKVSGQTTRIQPLP